MTRDDIIKLAREAGLLMTERYGDIDGYTRFAALIAAQEREACAKLFDGEVWSYDYREIAAAIRARGEK